MKIDLVNKITISRNGARNFTSEVNSSIEGLFNSFESEVSVTSVDDFKESNLWVTCEVNILLF